MALVTGGNSGIGLAAAKHFVKDGATAYVTGRRQAELDGAVRAIGSGAIGVQGDVSNLQDLDRLYVQIEREQGRLDVVFVNAAAAASRDLAKSKKNSFDKEFGTNVKATFFTVQKPLPLMKNGGSIILIVSTSSVTCMENFSLYSTTKRRSALSRTPGRAT